MCASSSPFSAASHSWASLDSGILALRMRKASAWRRRFMTLGSIPRTFLRQSLPRRRSLTWSSILSRGRCWRARTARSASSRRSSARVVLCSALRRRKPRGDHAHASAPRCDGGRGGVDCRGGAIAAKRDGLVATVGSVDAKPGAGNVIAGDVDGYAGPALMPTMQCDWPRSTSCWQRPSVPQKNAASSCAGGRRSSQPAVPMDADLTELLEAAVRCADDGTDAHGERSGP